MTEAGTGIWILRRTGTDNAAIYDATAEVVLLATSEREARRMAAAGARDEGPAVWLDGRYTEAHRIGVTDRALPAEFCVVDVHEG
jgi:hypothetical protein